jgi:hypothetical protein
MGNLLVSLFESALARVAACREAAIVSKYLKWRSEDAEVVAAKQKGGPKPPLV